MDVEDEIALKRTRRGRPWRRIAILGLWAACAVVIVIVGGVLFGAFDGTGASSGQRAAGGTDGTAAGAVNPTGDPLNPKAQEIACTWLFGPAENRPTIAFLSQNYANLSDEDASATTNYVMQFMPVVRAYVPAEVEPDLAKWGAAWDYASKNSPAQAAVKLRNEVRSIAAVSDSCAAAGLASAK